MERLEIESCFSTLENIFLEYSDGFYDVDMFCYDIRNYPWKDNFEIDSESVVNFNCAAMMFCHKDIHFGLAGQVILFLELSDWASEYFNNDVQEV